MEHNKGEDPLHPIISNIDSNYCETESSAGGLLARFWRSIVLERKYSIVKIKDMLTNYLEVIFYNKPGMAASNARGSYNKKLSEPRMSWGTFLEALGVLGVCKVKFTVELTYVDDTTSTHSTIAQIMTDDQKLRLFKIWLNNKESQDSDPEYLKTLAELEERIKKRNEEMTLKKSATVKKKGNK